MTEIAKNSLISAGLSAKQNCEEKKISICTIFFQINQEVFMVTIENLKISVEEAIYETIERLNNQQNLCLPLDTSQFSLYYAKKNGKMNSDLPALDFSTTLASMKKKKLYLNPSNKKSISFLETKESSSNLQSQFLIQGKLQVQKNAQINIKTQSKFEKFLNFFGCGK